jgi:hypothetical protein
METTAPQLQGEHMTPEQTLDWLAEQHKSQCNEDRPVQEWIRSMKSMLPTPVQEPVATREVLVKIARFLGVVRVYAQDIQPKHELETDKPLHWKARELQDEVIKLIDTTPPAAQRQSVGLTVDELITLEQKHRRHEDLSRAIEQRLKEKNT